MIRIVLADDHVMIRQAIARALADVNGFNVVGQVSTGEESIEMVARLTPDVVLMDIGMPGLGGLAATEVICKGHPQIAVLMLTIHDREDYFFKALNAGASGYILKGAELDELVEAVRAVARGETYIFPSLIPKLVADYISRARSSAVDGRKQSELTVREQEVIRLIAEGRTTAEIAEKLAISPHTVRRHRDHMMAKLNLHSKADLIRFAIQRGLLDESK
ncbi:MAG: nreC [Dehalococcoidia bacterium]|nr:nreC [Dehalococcoidia bacterium]